MRASRRLAVYSGGARFKFTYTGTYLLVDDGGGDWRLKFLTSGVFTPKVAVAVDIFAVGGGGGGDEGGAGGRHAGGGGGYTSTVLNQTLTKGNQYTVTVGAGGAPSVDGGDSSFDSLVTAGGGKKAYSYLAGGAGGSGGGGSAGNGGTNGGNGEAGSGNAGVGQGTTTREFAEQTGDLYAGGGGGNPRGLGGAGGGGDATQDGAANTGGGGGGATGSGGSGIVIIRNTR